MSQPPAIDVEALRDVLGCAPSNRALYRRALTHRSVLRGAAQADATASNERLEFLGDALLDVIVGEALYHRFPERTEGFLTRMRAKLVSGTALAQYARRLNLGALLRVSANAEAGGVRESDAVLADAFEALVGALYLDQGFAATEQFVQTRLLATVDWDALTRRATNYKSALQEHLQAQGQPLPTYTLKATQGPSHDLTFTVEVRIDGAVRGTGTAGSKKQAEQRAARAALRTLTDDT
ncbi:ribonuclease III [Salisaeta longa]|uniref:ribonuclease III n=1 Tax=Salisaeta longa TaxID=503170 RepID=UPI0003B61EA1|nr:ribonuclease III [Salisaeta longa]